MSKLLILDDSGDLLEALKYTLEHNGYAVKAIISADDIYNEINVFQPDLLLLDIFLNGKDGREICKELRTSAENKELPVLVFSSHTKALEDYESYYADDYIEKPFELKNLIEKIKSLLHSRNAQPFDS